MRHEYQLEVQALRRMVAKVRSRCYVDDGLFYIRQSGEYLEAVIDRYSATCPEAHTSAFDVDTWETLKIRLQAPCTKSWFKVLNRVCRGLLANRHVHLSVENGTWCLSMIGMAFIPREDDGRAYPEFYPHEQATLSFVGAEV